MSSELKNQLAVALHYDRTGAPRVIAKGKGAIGAKIVEVARAHDIPIEDNEVLGARNCVPLGQVYDDPDGQVYYFVEAMDPVDLQGELYTKDIVDLVTLQLSDTQQQIFFLLMKGFRVREIARELDMSHPAVIKHRKKIARIANEFIKDRDGCSAAGGYSGVHQAA